MKRCNVRACGCPRERTLDRDLLRHNPFKRSLSWKLVEYAGIVGTLAVWILGLIIWGAILGGGQ